MTLYLIAIGVIGIVAVWAGLRWLTTPRAAEPPAFELGSISEGWLAQQKGLGQNRFDQ